KVVTIYRRDTGEKFHVGEDKIMDEILDLLEKIKDNMRKKAKEKIERYITIVDYNADIPIEEIACRVKETLKEKKGIVLIPYSEKVYREDFEEKIEASILGITEYRGEKYITVGRTY
ncbi:MAG TPA: proline--tRNA ligase, partial [Methanothermococcus okinawensis]|nr:proline--tRNA ligase [Methanothermococcus okinawensis]